MGESTGVLASIEYRESHGGTWYPGDTVQAAIGQSDRRVIIPMKGRAESLNAGVAAAIVIYEMTK